MYWEKGGPIEIVGQILQKVSGCGRKGGREVKGEKDW